MITIIDYGMGNLGSIANMLKKIGVASTIASEPDDIAVAQKIMQTSGTIFNVLSTLIG